MSGPVNRQHGADLREYFDKITDPRGARGVRHSLAAMLGITRTWVRDVTYREDASRVRTGTAPRDTTRPLAPLGIPPNQHKPTLTER